MSAPLSLPDNALSRIGSSIVVIVGALLVGSIVAEPLTNLGVAAGLFTEGSTAWRVTRTVLSFLGILAATLGFVALTDEWALLRVDVPDRRQTALTVGAVFALLGVQYGALFALAQVGISPGENVATDPSGDPVYYYAALLVVSILVVGPAEEVLFRGVVQGGLRRAMDAAPAILLASALFGVIHMPAVGGTLVDQLAYVAITVLLGCILGALYERTGNLVVPCVAHGLYNAAVYATLLADVL